MLALGKKIDYALISLTYLAERSGQFVSAREIAEANDLPLPALMQILKSLNGQGVLRSTRGVKGGYQIGADLDEMSLLALSQMLDAEDEPAADAGGGSSPSQSQPPLETMRAKLSQFLRDVRVAEVVRPGRRIDVLLQDLRISERIVI